MESRRASKKSNLKRRRREYERVKSKALGALNGVGVCHFSLESCAGQGEPIKVTRKYTIKPHEWKYRKGSQ